jgi:hypothetical protein
LHSKEVVKGLNLRQDGELQFIDSKELYKDWRKGEQLMMLQVSMIEGSQKEIHIHNP